MSLSQKLKKELASVCRKIFFENLSNLSEKVSLKGPLSEVEARDFVLSIS